jgi:hypothetical protein
MADKCMVVLQYCMDLQKHVPGPCSETYLKSSLAVNQAMNKKVKDVSDIQEEGEDPVPIPYPAVSTELEVSCMCIHH